MRSLRDRDFLRTKEGFLFCVVGYAHPHERVVSYLKYVPSNDGRWGGGDEHYARTMPNYTIPSLLNNIEMLQKNYPQYVFHSRVFNIKMSAVPHNYIAERYLPEIKLQKLFTVNKLDSLQTKTLDLVSTLSNESGVSKSDFGITGSILTDIHNPLFSDIDLTIIGRENAWKVRNLFKNEGNRPYPRKSIDKKKTLDHWVKNYPLTSNEAETIYNLKWNYGSFKDTAFSIHAIRKSEEITEKYGEERFFPKGIVEGSAEVTNVNDSLFLPCKYKVKGLKIQYNNSLIEINDVISYDGFYSGLFQPGAHILVKGKLEEVESKSEDKYFRVLVGSPEAKGGDYIKPKM